MAVVQQFQQLVTDRATVLPRARFRSNFAALWATVHTLVQERQGKVQVSWIRGHAGNFHNEWADKAAAQAHTQGQLWRVDLSRQTDIRYTASLGDTLIETDLRQTLKLQSNARQHWAWTNQRRVMRCIPEMEQVEWRSAL
ncbi:hypothetical protein DFQ27_002374, partial [Actinomortierella ambigua]